MITYVIHGIWQLYANICEKHMIKRLEVSRSRKEIRMRYPYVGIRHPELINIGVGTEIMQHARLACYPDLVEDTTHIMIGEGCFIGYRVSIFSGADISIGNHVLMANDITIDSSNHGMNPESDISYMDQKLSCKPITIGDNCWLGEKVIVLAGVTIGKGSVIGAGSVVTKDIPNYSIAVGNPARVIKQYSFITHCWERV